MLQRDIIWLDYLPVAMYSNVSGLSYIEPDHLGSPRKLINPANNAVQWNWPIVDNTFGETAPTISSIWFNLRFPGQYSDGETNYNYFRDYEPGTGRYVESDPIGLEGGISTFGYVDATPLMDVDPSGQNRLMAFVAVCMRFPMRCIPPMPPRPKPVRPQPTDNGCGGPMDVPCPPMPTPASPMPIPTPLPIPQPFMTTTTDWPDNEEFCREQRDGCAKMCSDAYSDWQRKGVSGGSISQCIQNCLPEECGGEPKWKGMRK